MLNSIKLLAFVSIAALAVNAASSSGSSTATSPLPSSTAGLTACITGCLTGAESSSTCSSFVDFSCACTNTAFQAAAQKCLMANCTAAEQATALALQKSECANISGNSSASSSGTSSSAAHAATSSGAAMAKTHFGYGELVGAGVALVGAVIGGGLVL